MGSWGRPVELYVVAGLCGGGVHVVGVAVCALVLSERVAVDLEGRLRAVDGTGGAHLEGDVLAAIRDEPGISFGDLLDRVVDSRWLDRIRTELDARGLTHPKRPGRPLNRLHTVRGNWAALRCRRRGPSRVVDHLKESVAPDLARVAVGSLADLDPPDGLLADALFGGYWRGDRGWTEYGAWGWPHGRAPSLDSARPGNVGGSLQGY